MVRSMSEVYSVLRICGGRYGGSSRLNADASPRSSERERAHDVRNVSPIPRSATATTADAVTTPARADGTRAPMKSDAIRICVGQRPLQSEKLFVMIAISRSLGLSMIRVATIPAALHP